MKEQVLDSMDIERERGITIKAQTVRLDYQAKDGTPTSSTSSTRPAMSTSPTRSRARCAACEGSLLVVDASQGVEAQTLANVYQAHRQQPRDRPRPQQDRPARRRARAGQRADRGRDRPRRLRRRRDLGQDRPRHHRRARGDRHRLPAAEGRPRRAAEGAAGRQLVRRLSRRRRAGPHHRRRA